MFLDRTGQEQTFTQEQAKLLNQLYDYYQQFIGYFVFIEKYDGSIYKGVIKGFTPDKTKLMVRGTHKGGDIFLLNIKDFSFREDKGNGGGDS